MSAPAGGPGLAGTLGDRVEPGAAIGSVLARERTANAIPTPVTSSTATAAAITQTIFRLRTCST